MRYQRVAGSREGGRYAPLCQDMRGPTALDQWRIPEFVTVRGDRLLWHEGLGRVARPKQGMLEEFLGLADQRHARGQRPD